MEEEEGEEENNHLINQNESCSTFQIDKRSRSRSCNCNYNNNKILFFFFNKRYLFAITFPLIIIIVYFTADFKSLFRTTISSPPEGGLMMRESQLHALYLLQQQQSLLVDTLKNNSTSFQDLRSALIHQISLNKQIQEALEQHNNNVTTGTTFSSSSSNSVCHRRRRIIDDHHKLSRTTRLEWNPKQDKYLFAICTSGQMSNHLICLEKHMFFAALLNRVLVIPSPKVDYEFNNVLDIDHINNCLGKQVVLTFQEFADRKNNHMHIDKVLCYFSLPQPCYVDDDHIKKLKAIGVTMNELNTVWPHEDVKKPTVRTIQDVTQKFSSNHDVLAIGDVFFADVEKEWVMQPGGPIAHTCQALIEPSRVILLTAQRFIQTFLGQNFVALHFRRHGFLKFCNAKNPSCFFPIPQAAECISSVVERANMAVIYLSTDAADSETGLLQSLVTRVNGKTVPLVTRPPRNSAEKWDALLYRKKLDGDSQVEAMLDKTICALSGVFIGAPGSTFTEDILRLRRGWGTASVCDEYLCQGQLPNFIAGDE